MLPFFVCLFVCLFVFFLYKFYSVAASSSQVDGGMLPYC